MTKLPQHGTFVPLFHVYLDLGLSYHQAALVAYIDKWNRGGNECFASVEEIATELRLTYRTMRRVIDRSLAQGIITGSVGDKGRARTLRIVDSFLAKVEAEVAKQESEAKKACAQNEQIGVQNGQGMCPKWTDQVSKVDTLSVQSGQLPRYNLDINLNKNTKNSKNNFVDKVYELNHQALNELAMKFKLRRRFTIAD